MAFCHVFSRSLSRLFLLTALASALLPTHITAAPGDHGEEAVADILKGRVIVETKKSLHADAIGAAKKALAEPAAKPVEILLTLWQATNPPGKKKDDERFSATELSTLLKPTDSDLDPKTADLLWAIQKSDTSDGIETLIKNLTGSDAGKRTAATAVLNALRDDSKNAPWIAFLTKIHEGAINKYQALKLLVLRRNLVENKEHDKLAGSIASERFSISVAMREAAISELNAMKLSEKNPDPRDEELRIWIRTVYGAPDGISTETESVNQLVETANNNARNFSESWNKALAAKDGEDVEVYDRNGVSSPMKREAWYKLQVDQIGEDRLLNFAKARGGDQGERLVKAVIGETNPRQIAVRVSPSTPVDLTPKIKVTNGDRITLDPARPLVAQLKGILPPNGPASDNIVLSAVDPTATAPAGARIMTWASNESIQQSFLETSSAAAPFSIDPPPTKPAAVPSKTDTEMASLAAPKTTDVPSPELRKFLPVEYTLDSHVGMAEKLAANKPVEVVRLTGKKVFLFPTQQADQFLVEYEEGGTKAYYKLPKEKLRDFLDSLKPKP